MKNLTAVVDTREQTPLKLQLKPGEVLKAERGNLYTGDYSIKGLENHVAIERKSIDDLMGCIGKDRERFEREIARLRGYPVKALVVEATWEQIESGSYRSKVHPSSAIGTMMGWISQGIPVTMAGNHDRAGTFVARMLYITARRRLAELKSLG